MQTPGLYLSTEKPALERKIPLNCDQFASNGTAKARDPATTNTGTGLVAKRLSQPRTVTSNRVPCEHLSAVSHCC